MPRPPKCRRVAFIPDTTYFKPAGIPMRVLEEIVLSLEEAEAVRLKDIEGLEQEEGARRMNVSRPTFQRVLASARQKVADALLHGKAIRIGGGNFEMARRRFRCFNGHEWDIPIEVTAGRNPDTCPTCRNADIVLVAPVSGNYDGRGHGRHRGGRRGM